MSVKPSDSSYMWCSISAHLAERVNDFRNQPMGFKKGEAGLLNRAKDLPVFDTLRALEPLDECCGFVLMRRTLAEGFYLVIAIAAAVETVVRLPLVILGTLLSYACDPCEEDDDCGCNYYIECMFWGSWESFQTACYAIEALFYNPTPCARVMESDDYCFYATPIRYNSSG